jgi:hypothetical protein
MDPDTILYLLSGTSIKLHGRLGGGGGNLLFRLDGNNTNVPLNGTNFADGPMPLYNSGIMEDGDHQLLVFINSLQQNGTVAVDFFEYVVPSHHSVIIIVFYQLFCFQG